MAERQAEIIKEAGQVLQATLEAYEINTRLRIAHFLGQTCHESAGFRTTEEFASGAA
jgi:putative chitinase